MAARWRRTLHSRLTMIVVMALVAWAAVTAIAVGMATRGGADTVVRQWMDFGRHAAASVEAEIERELRRLDRIAEVLEHGGDAARLTPAIQDLRLAESVVRLSPDGAVRWARSTATAALVDPPFRRLDPPDGGWRGRPTGLIDTAHGARSFLVLPARESDPDGGAIAGVIAPGRGTLAQTLASYRNDSYTVDLLDQGGRALASSRGGDPPPDVLAAVVEVPRTPWHVRVWQPRDAALAPVNRLRRFLIGGSIVLMGVALLIAWGTARSIRQPVLRLTAAAEQLTDGALETPIAVAGEDEIGRLAHALETLRQALRQDERRNLLLRRVLSVQEDERRRIARELHDQTTQQLTALALQLDMATPGRAPGSGDLSGPRALVGRMIDDLHRLIYDLRPSILDDLGLLPAIESFARDHLVPRGIAVHCEMPAHTPALDPIAATAVYRVVQEALMNVARHAGAEAVQVACSLSETTMTIEVEDDGRGFDPAEMAQPRHTGEGLGLLGMRERLALIGGRLVLESAPGSGTRVVIEVPLEALQAATPEVRA